MGKEFSFCSLFPQNKKTNSGTSKQINGKDFIDFLVTVKYGSGEIPAVSGNVFVDYYNQYGTLNMGSTNHSAG